MKKIITLTLALVGIFSLTSCFEDDCTSEREVSVYEPIYLTAEEINNPVIQTSSARAMENPGKVFYIGTTLFISEQGEGVHIIDNSDKSNPKPISFLEIPGNIDVSFNGKHLIADSYYNILFIDLENLSNPTVTASIDELKKNYFHFDEAKDAYVVDYVYKNETRKLKCNHPFFQSDDPYYYYDDYTVFAADGFNPSNSVGEVNTSSGSQGVAGSLSSFAIVGDYFYYIDREDVNVYNIEDLQNIFFTDGFEVAWNIETLFPYEDKLFIGGQNGMYIYDNSDPSSPVFLSEFIHARACDPVFVEGNTAYVTLSEGNTCANFTNQLDVIDITDVLNPTLIKSYDMYRPKGLSIYENTLFLCDDKAGIKVYDVSDKENIDKNKLASIQGNTFIEVIHTSTTEIMGIGPEGIFQYDVSEKSNPILLSHLAVSIN